MQEDSTPPKPFTTDGCSGGMSRTWKWLAKKSIVFRRFFGEEPPWEDLCVEHDKAYWKGGRSFERTRADRVLAFGIFDRHGYRWLGALVQFGVWFGGSPLWPFPWRWGYGWPYFRGYTASTHLWSIHCPLLTVVACRPYHQDRQASFQISLWPKREPERSEFCPPQYAFSICASWNWKPYFCRMWGSPRMPGTYRSFKWTGRDCEIIGWGWNAAVHIQAGSWQRSFRPWLGK